MLKGRLGLQGADIPQRDRHGLLWLGRGRVYVDSGTLRFCTAGDDEWAPGDYAIPYQMLTAVLLQPGSTVSHDAFRILARHGTALVVVGTGGVRLYASLPKHPDQSARARRHAMLWSDANRRVDVARRMYAWRFGEVLPSTDLDTLRGIEGSRVRMLYKQLARQYGIQWRRRDYDRQAPETNDLPNNAINHASVAVLGAAEVAVAVSGAIPQLGFIHEDSGYAFALDIADLYRHSVIVPEAFASVAQVQRGGGRLEQVVRTRVGKRIRRERIVSEMIDRIKSLLDDPLPVDAGRGMELDHDAGGNP